MMIRDKAIYKYLDPDQVKKKKKDIRSDSIREIIDYRTSNIDVIKQQVWHEVSYPIKDIPFAPLISDR